MAGPERRLETGRLVEADPPELVILGDRQFTVTAAGEDDLGLVADILEEASRWLESRGIPAWPQPFPVDWIRGGMRVGTCYLAWDGTTPVATFTLQWTDPAFWGERPDEGPNHARHLHRLAVRRSYRGLGRALLDLAEDLTRRSGAKYLRLDCLATDPGIRAYYEAAGFEYRGDVDVVHREPWRASLYEKIL
jgi:GNAT superfamily N-acetyltransferase